MEAAMTKSWTPILFTLSASLFLALTLGCGTSNRQLQSIAINTTGAIEGNMIQLQFVAAGTFNASPTAVNPLPVSWYVVPHDTTAVYTLTSQPLTMMCQTGSSVIALAPTNPNAPSSGTIPSQVFQDLVINHTIAEEGGFVASTAQYAACP
jgi:hypothetical protein